MVHALTIDVEDYWSVFARDWLDIDGPPTDAVVRNTRRFLELLGGRNIRATFFILGEVAESFPGLVKEIARGGHEVGVHGFYHHQLFKLSREAFAKEVGQAKALIEDITALPARGHRAPAFSIGPDTAWGLEVLAELGFEYDSSVYPIAGKRYGWPGFAPDIHEMALPDGGKIIEVPMSVITVLGKSLPACGGGYIRHLPYWYTRWAMRHVGRRRPAVVYMHPYEIDTTPPPARYREALTAAPSETKRFHALQMRRRESVGGKLVRLLDTFQFVPIAKVIDTWLESHDSGEISTT